jgi:dTDP-4-dehydrorhamnose 3,5-epimerase
LEAGLPTRWLQDNRSRSRKHVLRGLHFQSTVPQGKLVWVVSGEAFDVAVDVRRGSPTFGKWFGTILRGGSPMTIYIPPGFAHGLLALADDTEVAYKCDALYDPSGDRGVRWDDPALGIEWPVDSPLLSEKDRALPTLAELEQERDVLPAFDRIVASASSRR